MPIVTRKEREVGGTISSAPKISLPTVDTGAEARLLGDISGSINRLSKQALASRAKKEQQATVAKAKADKLLLQEKKKHDETLATGAYTSYQKITVAQDSDLLNRTGYQALNISADMSDQIAPEYKRIRDGLENDEQKRLFEKVAASHALIRKDQYNKYERTEESKASQQGAISVLNNATNLAVNSYDDPRALKKALSDIDIFTERALPGAPPEKKKEFKEKLVSDIHVGRIKAYLSDDKINEAIGYYNGIVDKILPADRITTKASLDHNDTLQQAQSASDDIIVATKDPNERIELVKNIKDPAVRKEADTMVRTANSDDERNKKRQHDIFMSDKINQILDAKSSTARMVVADSAQNGDDRLTLQKIAADRSKPKKITTDLKVKTGMLREIDSDGLTTKDQIIEYAAGKDISQSDVEFGMEYLQSGGLAGKIKINDFDTLYLERTGETNIFDNLELYDRMYEYTKRELQVSDKVPTQDALREIIKKAAVVGVAPTGEKTFWTGRDKVEETRYFEDRINWRPIVTDAEREEASKAFQGDLSITQFEGKQPTDEQVELYVKHEIMKLPVVLTKGARSYYTSILKDPEFYRKQGGGQPIPINDENLAVFHKYIIHKLPLPEQP